MKRSEKPIKNSASGIRFKILLYFLSFTFIILLVLWLSQTVFLDDLYRTIKTHRINACSEYIVSNIESENLTEQLDDIHRENDMDIEIYNTANTIFFSVYSSQKDKKLGLDILPHEVKNYYQSAKSNNGQLFLEETMDAKYSPGHKSEVKGVKTLTCIRIINVRSSQYMLILKSHITPVTSTVETIQFILVIITVLLISLSVLMSILISSHVAKPLQKTTQKALKLAKADYSVRFDSHGYREVEQLNDALNFAAGELQITDSLRKDLIANVSHDLRTPLTMITGYAEVMRDIPGENNEKNLQAIIDESKRLTGLVNDLLDISKLQSNAIPIKKTVFCLTDCTREILNRFCGLCSQRGYEITFCADEDVFVFADESRISQVLYNLISNAVNYSEKEKKVKVTQLVENGFVRINVTDSGEGIEADQLKNIWDRYYRVDKVHRRAIVGTGLGLSIVKEILDMHNAGYGVYSTLGVSSTFWFELKTVTDEKDLKNSTPLT